jgi:tetratricopeptide (TPR) repeat protein
MKLIGQLIDKFGRKPDTGPIDPARQLLDTGQWAKRAEDYAVALEHISRARQIAEARGDQAALAIISLHQADVLLALGRLQEAEHLLLNLRHEAQTHGQRAQISYALSALGVLEQAQGHWDEARAYYEQALKTARAGGSLGAEGRAMSHLADTYLHENNASYAVHLLRDALPKLNLSGDIEFSSYFVGQLGGGLIAIGHETEGERLLYRALRIAEQMKYRRYERQWALALASRTAADMRYEESLRLYRQALPLFSAETPGYIESLCETSRICMYLGETESAQDYARQAYEIAQAGSSSELVTLAQGTLGMALRASGRASEAIPHLQQAVGSATTRSDGLQLEIMRALGAALTESGETQTALTVYEQVLQLAQAEPLEAAQTHLEIGLLHERRRDMETAIEHWKKALTLYESEHYYAQVARLYCDIGGARRFLGQGKRAMREYEQALMILSSVDDWSTRGVVISNAAIAYAELGDSESAEAFFDESIEIANRLEDRIAEATRRGNYGWFLLSTGRPQRAIVTLEQALRISQHENLRLQIAIQTDNLGLAYDTLGEFDRALTYHREALAHVQPLNNAHWESTIQINLAQTLLRLGQDEEARPLLRAALDSGRTHADTEVIVRALIGQARLSLRDQQPQDADALLTEAVLLARRADMRRQLAEALQVQSEQQAALNDPARSLTLWDEAHRLFTMLQMPQANLEPEWLKDQPIKS